MQVFSYPMPCAENLPPRRPDTPDGTKKACFNLIVRWSNNDTRKIDSIVKKNKNTKNKILLVVMNPFPSPRTLTKEDYSRLPTVPLPLPLPLRPRSAPLPAIPAFPPSKPFS